MYTCIHVYMYLCIYVYMYICKYVYMYICIYVFMYICIQVYIFVWNIQDRVGCKGAEETAWFKAFPVFAAVDIDGGNSRYYQQRSLK